MMADMVPPVLIILSAESPSATSVVVSLKLDEVGTAWCNSWITGSVAMQDVNFNSITAGGHSEFVPDNTTVAVSVDQLSELVQYDTYCTAQDAQGNAISDPTARQASTSIGPITTLDQTPPVFTFLNADGISENTIRVTFECSESCSAYCAAVGEPYLPPAIEDIFTAAYSAEFLLGEMNSPTIDVSGFLNDTSSRETLEADTSYDIYCWIHDAAVKYHCRAKPGGGSICWTTSATNAQTEEYTHNSVGTPGSPLGGAILAVRTLPAISNYFTDFRDSNATGFDDVG